MFRKILACSDGSDRSIKAVERAAEEAKLHGAILTLLHVCQVPETRASFPGAPTLEGPALERYIRDMHLAVIERTLPAIQAFDVRCHVLEEIGNPIDIIARIANQQDYDLVVLGSRGVSTERAEQLGSVCHGVIHSVSCPILIVR